MINTNLKVKTGKDFVNFFYNVPEEVLPTKIEGKAVEKITIEVFVEEMLFFRQVFRFCGGDPSNPFGYVTVPQLGESEYTFRVTESLVQITKDRFIKEPAGTEEYMGSFTISETNQKNGDIVSVKNENSLCYVH